MGNNCCHLALSGDSSFKKALKMKTKRKKGNKGAWCRDLFNNFINCYYVTVCPQTPPNYTHQVIHWSKALHQRSCTRHRNGNRNKNHLWKWADGFTEGHFKLQLLDTTTIRPKVFENYLDWKADFFLNYWTNLIESPWIRSGPSCKVFQSRKKLFLCLQLCWWLFTWQPICSQCEENANPNRSP